MTTGLLQWWIPALVVVFFALYYLAPKIGLDLGLRQMLQNMKTNFLVLLAGVGTALDGFSPLSIVPAGHNPVYYVLGFAGLVAWASIFETKRK